MTRQAPGATIGALIAVVHGLRPDWDRPGIRAVVEAAYGQGHALGLVAAAAVDAAITASTKTPAGITARLTGGWGSATHGWTKEAIDQHKLPPEHSTSLPRCGCCKAEILTHAGETRETHICPPTVTDRTTGERVRHVCGQSIDPASPTRLEARQRIRAQIAAAKEAHEQAVAEARRRELHDRGTVTTPAETA